MKRFLFGMVALGLVVTAGCTSDPTAEFRTGPARVVASRSFLQLLPGDSVSIIARTLDDQGNTVMPLPEITVGDAAVATTSVDSNFTLNPNAQLSFYVKGVAPGETNVNLVTGTEADSVVGANIQTLVFPVVFPGTASVNSTGRLDEVTLTADPVVEFDTSGTSSVLVDGASADILSLTATEMVFSWSSASAVSAAQVTLADVLFLGEFPVPELELGETLALTADSDEPANDQDAPSGGTLTTITFGAGVINRGSSSGGDVRDFWCVTVPGGSTDFEIGWGDSGADADIDVFLLSGCAGSFSYGGDITGFAMATGANPEAWTGVLTPGDYMILIEVYDVGGVPEPFWYHIGVRLTPF